MTDFVLFTSLPRRLTRMRNGQDEGIEYQRACVESWVAAGFTVVSVNGEEEAAALQSACLPMTVQATNASGPPLISEMLALAAASNARLCGIINGDCMFVESPGLASTLSSRSKSSLLYCERIDINPETDLPIPGHCGGFDAFFFEPRSVRGVSDSFFHLGNTWWDYWFPCELAANGIRLQRLSTPFTLHLSHERAWSQESFEQNGEYFRRYLEDLVETHRAPVELEKILVEQKRLSTSSLANSVYAWLRTRCETKPVKLLGTRNGPMEDLLRKLRESHLIDGKRQTNEITSLQKINSATRDKLRHLMHENNQLKGLRQGVRQIVNSPSADQADRNLHMAWWPIAIVRIVAHSAARTSCKKLTIVVLTSISFVGLLILSLWLSPFDSIRVVSALMLIAFVLSGLAYVLILHIRRLYDRYDNIVLMLSQLQNRFKSDNSTSSFSPDHPVQ